MSASNETKEIQEVVDSKLVDSSCQTDEELIYNYAWSKYYYHFNKTSQTPQSTNQISNNLIAQKNGIYFDTISGLYYDQADNLYFDKENKIYYHYVLSAQTKSYHLRYHSQMDEKKWKILSQKLELSDEIIWLDDDSNDELERYVQSEKTNIEATIKNKLSKLDIKKPENIIEIDSDVEDGEILDITNQYPPCIRAILNKSSDKTKLGSLFLVPYTGGLIGKNSSKLVIDLSNEIDIDDQHASIEYDLTKKTYLLHVLSTKYQLYLNENILLPNEKYPINHGDVMHVGKSASLLLHIHSGSNTCTSCEPGEVMQKFKKESKQIAKTNIEEERREINKSIKKKYGIKWDNLDTGNDLDYNDRSKIRRKKEGIDISHIEAGRQPTAASASKPIDNSNIGKKMLKSMGWKEGSGLGREGTGIKEPVTTILRERSAGLGFGSSNLSLESTEEEKKKQISWTKTKARFNLIEKQSEKLSSVFNVESDEEE